MAGPESLGTVAVFGNLFMLPNVKKHRWSHDMLYLVGVGLLQRHCRNVSQFIVM